MLDFRIETFLCVCKHMNYTKAAEELNLTQPGVSQHIKYLEQYYRTKLFSYEKKILMLTNAGKILRDSMLSMRHDSLYLKEQIYNGSSPAPELKFGATLTISEFLLPEKLSVYLKKNPLTRLQVTTSDTRELIAKLDDGSIDFALVEGYFNKTDYDFELIQKESLLAVCSTRYPLPPIRDFPELFSHHLLVREQGSGTREVFARYLDEHGYIIENFEHRSVFNSIHIMKQLLLAGHGISFLYRSTVEEQLAAHALRTIPIPDFSVTHEFNFIWRKNSIYSDYYKKVYHELF